MKHKFLRRFWSYLRPYKYRFLLAFALRLGGDLANLVPAWLLSRIVYKLSYERTGPNIESELTYFLIIWLVISLVRPLFKGPAKYLGYKLAESMGLDARVDGLAHVFKLDSCWQEKENSGNKLKRINHGAKGLTDIVRAIFSVIIESIVNTVGILIIIFSLDTEVALLFMFFMISYYTLSVFLSKRATKQARVVNAHEEALEGVAFESLNNIRTIKALGISKNTLVLVQEVVERVRTAINRRVFLFQTRNMILATYYRLFEVSMVVFIVISILDNRYDISFLVLFLSYLGKAETSIDELSEVTHELVISIVYVNRLSDILDTNPTIEVDLQQLDYPKDWKSIQIKNLSFAYQNRQVLKNINLTINRGEKIGIVGLSGAGKSTLFGLLLDLYEDYQGDILVDDLSLKEISRLDYIKNVSTVMQDTELFNLSLKDNILLANTGEVKSELTQGNLDRSVNIANLGKVIEKLPNGIDTIVGEKGIKLSGGERQRLGIARAVFRDPDILLLDEATSHLDVDSEKEIQKSLETFFKSVTAVVIAHRLTTIRNMDRIVVMSDGQIVEEGTFDVLLALKGHFYRLWEKMNTGS